jgi:hypothetical protein
MGLDMYLTRKLYIGAEYKHRNVTGSVDIQIDGKPLNIDINNVSYIEGRAGYWRKANAVHQWFVENVQDGVDDCGTYDVSREDLQSLLDVVNGLLPQIKLTKGQLCTGKSFDKNSIVETFEPGKVVENPEVCEVLPTTSGFFFGNTDYNEWYVQDLTDTKAILEENLKPEYANYEFSYYASW